MLLKPSSTAVKKLVQDFRRWLAANWGLVLLTGSALYFGLAWLWRIVFRIYYQANQFDGFAIDGTFQVLNPLRRIAAGQIPGADFQFFHGLGTILVHYPIFALFGKNLFASELSREVISPLFYVVAAAALLYVTFRKVVPTIVGSAIMLVVSPLIVTLIQPAGSIVGVRSTVPLLVGAAIIVLYRQTNPKRTQIARWVVLGLLALAFVMSVEEGLAAIAAYFLVEASLGQDALLERGKRLLRDLGIVVAFTLLGFLMISGPSFLKPLGYALKDLPGDQFWFYGVPPNSAILSLVDVFYNKLLIGCWFIALAFLVIVLKFPVKELRAEKRGFSYLLVYGLITTFAVFGIQLVAYMHPLMRVEMLTVIAFGYFGYVYLVRDRQTRLWSVVGLAVGIFVLQLLVGIPDPYPPMNLSTSKVSGTHLSTQWKIYLDQINKVVPKSASLWSVYTSLAEAQRGTFNPSGYDYMIHALGPERRREYNLAFATKRPDFVNTPRRAYTRYEEWLEMTYWRWYEMLYVNYSHVVTTPFSNVWKKHDTWKNPDSLGWLDEIKTTKDGVVLDKVPTDLPDGSIVTVQVDYQARNWLSAMPIVGKMARFFVGANDSENTIPVSLPPYETRWQFPVATKAGFKPELSFYTGKPIPGAHLFVKAVRYRILPLDQATLEEIQDVPANPAL